MVDDTNDTRDTTTESSGLESVVDSALAHAPPTSPVAVPGAPSAATGPGATGLAGKAPDTGPPGGLGSVSGVSIPQGGFPREASAAAGPGVLRSILGVFLTGISAGIQGGPGPQGPARAAAIGAQTEQAALDRPRVEANADLDTQMKKAQLAMLQIGLQRQIALFHQDEPLMQDAKLAAWIENGKQVEKNAAQGQGEILFTTSPDQSPDEAFQALNTQWMAQMKNGNYDVVPYATGDPRHPQLGLYQFKSSKWKGGDYWSSANPKDPEHPIETRIPDGIKAAGTQAVQKWGQTVDSNMEKKRHDEAQAAAKLEQIGKAGEIKTGIVKRIIQGQNWRAQLHEEHADGRAKIAAARTTGDKEYLGLVKEYQAQVDKADKWTEDHKLGTMLGWTDNPFSGSVDALRGVIQTYETNHPEILNAASPTAPGKTGGGGPAPQAKLPWSKSQYKAANPGKDADDAERRARASGRYNVTD